MKKGKDTKNVISVAWYRKDQWERLQHISSDTENFQQSYDDMIANAEMTCQHIQQTGNTPIKVDVDVDELLAWCQLHRFPVNGATRAEYLMMKLKEMIAHGDIDVV